MSALSGVVGGVLALSALQAISSSSQASGRLGSLLSGVGTVVEHLASPNVPAIPDLRASSGGGSTPSPAPTVSLVPSLAPSARLPLSA